MRAANPTLTAGLLMGLAALLAGLDAAIVRMLAGQVHPLVMGFHRAAFGLIFVLPWIARHGYLRASPWRWMHVLRAGLKLASLVALFVAYAHAPLADATAMTFTMPLLAILGAWLFLGEAIGGQRLSGVVIGFLGILIVLRPGGQFDPWLLFALIAAVLTAVIQLMLRHMALTDTTQRLVAWNLIAMVPLGLLVALPVWTMPTPAEFGLMAAQGAIGALNMTVITRAYAMADVSILAPLDFLRLPVIAALAWLLFHEIAPPAVWLGAVIIFAGAMLGLRSARPSITDSPSGRGGHP